ncbi:unnamed protein product [Didymodactylos carnosus]|uniref:EF-hand domain-containing protein n=1 Tax=Didymodactylos carnosus TaxID=1234261 RepID=A0A8S2D298_9BILA|nr:unnamed protein product [Didymodactylos carnosus]CAF3568460.1 unnamed protein product [Didymodactylos carnosus]
MSRKICTNYYSCKIALYDQLLQQSRSSIRPVQYESEKINVSIDLAFVRLISVNEEDSLLQVRTRINQTWNALTLSWNPLNYFNVTNIRVPAHLVWTPKISLINQHSITDNEENNFISIQSTGQFEFNYLALLTVPCDFDLQRFPFDQQTCLFKLGSFVYDSSTVSITQATDYIFDDNNLTPSEYTFVSHKLTKQESRYPGSTTIYDMIVIELDINRRSTYFIHLINWPGFLLALLSLTIFLLPPRASERTVLGVLLVIGQILLFSIFARYIPKRLASNWGWMGRTIFYDMAITVLAIISSVIVRFLSDKHYCNERPSLKIRAFVFGWLTKLVGLKRSSYATLIANRENFQNISQMGCTGSKKKQPLNDNDNKTDINGSPELNDKVVNYLLENTKFKSQDIYEWWVGFLTDCPNGILDKKKFIEVYKLRYPDGKANKFCDHVFRTFNPDKKSNSIDFQRFMCAIDVTLNGSPTEKLEWAFNMYDINADNRISMKEMTQVVDSMYDLLGKEKTGEDAPKKHVEQIFKRIDTNKDKFVSREEFLKGCQDYEKIRDLLAPNY